MQKARKVCLNRAISLLLVFVMMLGFVPGVPGLISTASANSGPSGDIPWNSTLTFKEFNKTPEGADATTFSKHFKFPKTESGLNIIGNDNSMVHELIVDLGSSVDNAVNPGDSRPNWQMAFCINHNRKLNSSHLEKKFNFVRELPEDNPLNAFLSYYYTSAKGCGGNESNNWANGSAATMVYIQAMSWAIMNNEAEYTKVKDEVKALVDMGFTHEGWPGKDGDPDYNRSLSNWKDLGDKAVLIRDLAKYRYEAYRQYKLYGSETPPLSTDDGGDYGAECLLTFQLLHWWYGYYDDELAQTERFKAAVYSKDSDTQQLVVGYRNPDTPDTGDTGRIVLFKNGEKQNNKCTPPPTTPVLRKIDAMTGLGVGPASFNFEGESDGSHGEPGSSSSVAGGGAGCTSSSEQVPIEGVVFEIECDECHAKFTMTTGAGGKAESQNLDLHGKASQTYKVKEVSAPSPYVASGTVFSVEVKSGTTSVNGGNPIVNGSTGGSTPGGGTPDTPGPDTPGPDTPGPDTPGPDTPGPDTPGPDTPGTGEALNPPTLVDGVLDNTKAHCNTCGFEFQISDGKMPSVCKKPDCSGTSFIISYNYKCPDFSSCGTYINLKRGDTPKSACDHCGAELSWSDDGPAALAAGSGDAYFTLNVHENPVFYVYGSRLGYNTSDVPFTAALVGNVNEDGTVTLSVTAMADASYQTASMTDDGEIYSASAVALANSGPSAFELPIEGATGFATSSITAGGVSLTPGQAFTILEETGSGGWKIKTSSGEGELSKSQVDACMINLPDVLPSMGYDIKNAYDSVYKTKGTNIPDVTGKKLYTSGKLTNPRFDGRSMFIVPLNYQVAKKLAAVQAAVKASGKTVVIYDAFRPMEAQMAVVNGVGKLFEDSSFETSALTDAEGTKWPVNWFIATSKSNHQMGYAIDCALATVNGSTDVTVGDKTVSIPDTWTVDTYYSPMHELSAESVKFKFNTTTPSSSMASSATATELHKVMTDNGMVALASEWWHFQGWSNSDAPGSIKAITGEFQCTECLSTAPDKASSEGGTAAPGASGAGESGGPTGGGSGTSTTTPTTPGTPATPTTPGTGTTTSATATSASSMPSGSGTSGPADDEVARYISADFQTDENGYLSIQWWDPHGDNYLAPGQYTVTEIQPPPGYDKTTEARHLVLRYNVDTGIATMSGPLIFENNKLKTLEMVKYDASGKPLEGAVFNLYRNDQLVHSGTTGPDGKFEYKGRDGLGVEEGYYVFKEVKAPAGKLLPYLPYTGVWVTPENLHDGDVISVSAVNYDAPEIVILKQSEDGMPLAGATFEVKINGIHLGEFTTDGSGKIIIDYGGYGDILNMNEETWTVEVREKTPPPGYLLDDDQWHEATFRRGQTTVPFVFTDTKYPEIKVIKRDINHPTKLLEGATFKVYVDSTYIDDFTTGEDGSFTISYGQYGRFLKDNGTDELNFDVGIQEVRAPEGYLITDGGLHTKQVTRGDKLVVFEFDDQEYPEIWIRKKDAETGQVLAGMTFEVEIDGQRLNEQYQTLAPTEENPGGWYKIRYEELDRFLTGDIGGATLDKNGYTITVTEVKPPEHYNMDQQPGSVAGRSYTLQSQLKPGQEHIEFTFEDNHYRSVKVRKIDSETGWGLQGAKFRLWSDTLDAPLEDSAPGAISSLAETDEDGWAYFYNLPNGWYYLEETDAPIGYSLEDGEWEGGDANIMDSGDMHNRITRFQVTSSSGHTDVGPYGEPVDDVCQACAAHKEIYVTDNKLDDSTSHEHAGTESYATKDVGKRENIHWLEFRRKNEPITGIRILKRDVTTNNPVAGAIFRITPQGNNPEESFTVTTNSEGVAIVENNTLKKGTYTIVEEYVPKPYILDPTPHIITIDNQHDAFEVPLYNSAEGVLYIRKLDSITGEPLAGAYFQITDGNGAVVGNGNSVGPTDKTGYIMFSPLEPGQTYVVKEIRSPDGHMLDQYPQTFTVPENVSSYVKELVFNNSPTANLWLKKVDAETGLPLQDAVFKITTADGAIVKQNAITDAEGFIKVNDLEPGTYFVEETTAPKGYMLDSTKREVVLRNHMTEVFMVKNYKPGGLIIRKVDAATNQALAGATFQLSDVNGLPIGAPVTTGADGFARWDTLEPGQYRVQETSAPNGYVLDSELHLFEVKGFKSVEYTWKNVQNATITVYKKDGETKTPLAGAEFEVRSVSGELAAKLVTDLNGSATTERLPLGFYQIIETKAPDGYQLLEEISQPVEVKAGTPTVVERYNYSDKIIIIQKRDALTKDPLPGAWFELTDIKGHIVQEQFETDASGVATSKPVEPGTYWLTETRAPNGYVLNDEPIKIVVEEGKSTRITVDNMPKTIIQIYKTDKYTNEPIMGVEFAIADKHGKIIELVQTDKTGWAYSQVLQPGDYIVTETKTVQGYGLDKTEHRVEVEDGKNYTLRLTNEPGVPIYIVKVDKETQKPLAGAKFELRYDTGHGDCAYIGTYITDEYGRITTEPVMPGFYMLKEVEAPKGYAILEEETRICVKAPDPNGAAETILNEFWIDNQELPYLLVKKVDSTNGSPIQGAVFKLETADHSLIGYQETDANGEATWYHLNPGHYIVTEVESPEDYDLTNCPSKTINVELGKHNYVEFKDTPYGSLQITLQDKQTSDFLAKGQFVIVNLKTMLEVTTFSTDVTGTFVIGSLEPGWYEVTQKYAPDGYTLLEAVIKVEIKAGEQSVIHFYNTTAGMVIEKVDAENTEKMLEGARFKVTRVTDAQVIGEYTTNNSGVALVSGLTPGIYTVEEIVAPTGYEISEKPKNVDIHDGATAHVTFLDSVNASITINVIDKDSKDPIPGVRVEVWQQNGNLVNTWTSDKTGMIETDKMAPGYYILKVVDLVTGYTLETKEVTVELKAAKETTYTFECKSSGSIVVSGKDDAGQLVGGIKFQVTDVNGMVIGTYTTNADGTFTLPNLAPGWYVATILENKIGYECGSMTQRFEVTANGSATIEFIHKRVSTVNVSAVDVNTQLGLNGVRFELWQQNGDKVGDYTTDKSGVVVINNVAMGMYVLKLVGTVDGYVAVKSEITFAVTDNRVIDQKFEFTSNSTLTVESKDANGFLAHMKFKVTDLNGTLIGEYETSDEGQTIIRDLKPGWYLVIETTAPNGFDLPGETEQRIEIKAGASGKITFLHESKGRIEIVITDDSNTPVADANFEIVDSTGKVIKTETTDATGKLVLTGVTAGSYTIRLVSVSEQYTISSKTEYTVTVTSGKTVTQNFTVIASGSLKVSSLTGSGDLVAGMKFEIRTISGELIGSYVTGNDGSCIIKNLAPGWYVVTEITAPDGLEIDQSEQRIEIKNSSMFTVEFTHKSLSDLVIDVIDKDTRQPVSGVTLELWVSNGDLVNKYVSSSSGEIRITAIANGNYVLKVTSVPEGFTAVKTEININITSNRNITETVELISAGTLAVRSEDNASNLISGMSFTVKTASGSVIGSFKTDSTGIYVINGLAPGEYVITEDAAPGTWNIDESNREIRVQVTSSKRVDATFKHIASSSVTVDVVNNGEPVNGAVIELWHQNGSSMVATWTTDYTGRITIDNIAAGMYILKLTKYPDAMQAVQTEITIEITQNQSLNYKFELTSNGTVTVISADDEGKRLPGMSFEIRDLNETLIGSYTTDQNGEYKFDNFAPGWYIITETVAPGEFNLDDATKSQKVEVKVGQHLDVTFTHSSKSDLVVRAIDTNGGFVAGVSFELYVQNGDLIASYTTEADGTVKVLNLANGYYVLKVTNLPEGYKIEETEYTIEVTTGRTITFDLKLTQNGILKVQSVATDGTFLGGMQFTVKTLDGTPIVNGTTTDTSFVVGATGEFTFTTLQPGWYIVTETKAPDGYNINTETQEQRIEVKAGAIATVKFEHVKTFGLQIRTTVAQTSAVVAGAVYDISSMEGTPLKTVTSGEDGIAFADLTPGWYVVTPKTAPDGYVFTDASPKNVEVKGDALTVLDMTVTQLSSIRVKVINGTTGAPVYNVRIQLKNGDNVISEYYTDNEGYITLDKSVIAGGFKIEMIAVPDGYILDTIPKSISVENGATTEIVWKIYNEGGQIQVEVKSSAENVTLDKPAGSVLQGAVFEVTNPDTYQVVATMISDARGIAASPALPIGRYIVKMVAAPPFYGLNESWSEEVRIKINNDVVRVNATCPSVTLGASITQKTNSSATAGSNIRVDILTADSKSDVRLDNFYIHIKVPTDAARIVSLNPGKWNKPVWYKISYKTNANDYRELAKNLNSENNYTYDLSTQSLGLQSGEYVTDVRFEFGTVPAGFAMVSKTSYGLYIQGVPNGYKLINRLEMGGQHSATVLSTNHITNLGGVANIPAELAQSVIGGGEAVLAGSTGQWVTNTSIWTVTVKNTGKLPKTGY